MNLPDIDMHGAVLLTASVAAIGIAYDALEFYHSRHEVLEQFYDKAIIRSRYYILIRRPVRSCLFDLACAPKTFMTAVVAHAFAALLFPVIFCFNTLVAALFAGFVLSVHCLTNIRLLVGRDGADQMQSIVWAGLCAYCLPITDTARTVAVGFVAAQLIFSYWTSGIAKLVSPVWRNGTSVSLITRMATYCTPRIAHLCGKPIVSCGLAWMIICFEISSPFLLLGGRRGALAFIALGISFHCGIATMMGLTTFVFAFVATFPIVYHLAGRL